MEDARSRSTGVPTLRVLTRCEHTAALIERYAGDVGPSGVFVRTRDASVALGALVRFEYLLADGRCALAGEGRVVFRRGEDEVGATAAGLGIAFDKLRTGDRVVVERMRTTRGATPSRFEQPSRPSSVPPRPSLRADALFADVKITSGDAAESAAAFLSADLTSDLPTVRPPSSMPVPMPGPAAHVEPLAVWNGDLADQLEPARVSALDSVDADTDATPAFVPLEEPEEPEAAESRAIDPEREQRVASLTARASSDPPPAAPVRVLLLVLVVLALIVLSLLGLAPLRGWLGLQR